MNKETPKTQSNISRCSPASIGSDGFVVVSDFDPDKFILPKGSSSEPSRSQTSCSPESHNHCTSSASPHALLSTCGMSIQASQQSPSLQPAHSECSDTVSAAISTEATIAPSEITTFQEQTIPFDLASGNDSNSRVQPPVIDARKISHNLDDDDDEDKQYRERSWVRKPSRTGRSSIFGINFLPVPEERNSFQDEKQSNLTVYRAKTRKMPEPVPSESDDHSIEAPFVSSSGSPRDTSRPPIRHSVLLNHIAFAPIVGHKKLYPCHYHDDEEEFEDNPKSPLSPISSSSSFPSENAKKAKKKKKKHNKYLQSIDEHHRLHDQQGHRPASHYPPHTRKQHPHKLRLNKLGRPNIRLQDLESGPQSDEDDEYSDRSQGVNHDLHRIFARQRQQMPCNFQYDFNLVLIGLMTVVVFLMKPLFALLGWFWQTLQRTFLPDHTSTFDILIGCSVILLYSIWLPIILVMSGVAAVLSLSGLIYTFRRCCVPVVEELEIDKNIQDLQRKLSTVTAPQRTLTDASSGVSKGFLSSYTSRFHEQPQEASQNCLPGEDNLMSPFELLVLPLLIAGDGILSIRV